ncbi:hypothetical protein BH24CHL6_BH24CHL6_04590 [soil metagenome]
MDVPRLVTINAFIVSVPHARADGPRRVLAAALASVLLIGCGSASPVATDEPASVATEAIIASNFEILVDQPGVDENHPTWGVSADQ